MIWLIVGLIVFFGAHLQRRLLPGLRKRLQMKLGENGFKGVIALMSVIGLVLIIVGFRLTNSISLYDLGPVGLLLNNITMMLAVALLGLGHSKSRFRRLVRHPMLLSLICWSASHLLVNGDLTSIILFLSFGLWASVEIILINRATINYQPFTNGTLKGDIRFIAIAILAYFIISLVHLHLGVNPFF